MNRYFYIVYSFSKFGRWYKASQCVTTENGKFFNFAKFLQGVCETDNAITDVIMDNLIEFRSESDFLDFIEGVENSNKFAVNGHDVLSDINKEE